MVERQDIDALLISALYGELTPAEETRLAAHLESHPADRNALADLTAARAAVRESRILQVQLEPPPSVSALLMQEAARRAPKAAETAGWFQRFMRSFMLHPAMAAAAMLVLVVGVATIVTNRQGDHFAESTAPASPAITQSTADEGAAGQAIVASGSTAGSAAFGGNTEAAPPGVDQYRATLAEGDSLNKGGAKDMSDRPADGNADVAGLRREQEAAKQQERKQRLGVTKNDRPDNGVLSKKSAPVSGVELRKPQPMPKDLDAAKESSPSTKTATRAYADDEAKLEQGAPGGGAASGSAPRAPSPEPAPAMRPSTVATPPPPPKPTAPRDERAGEKTVDRSRAAGPTADKAPDPQLAWARAQHASAVAQANAGKCQTAASLAITIENRAPSYYAQNVSTDRALKNCSSYIIAEREKEAERKAERARSQKQRTNEPARRAVDQPAKPTTTESK